MELLLGKGSLIEAIDKDNNTPLHLAIIGGYTRIAELILELLLKTGALVEAMGGGGNSPLHLAMQSKHIDIVELLLERFPNRTYR